MSNRVKINSESYGDSYDNGEEFGDWWDTNTTTYINLTKTSAKFDEEVDFVPVIGETYYLVAVEYSTGNSFGHSSGCQSVIGVFQTIEEANSIRDMIVKDANENEHSFTSLEYKGRNCIYTGTWKGYFESFDGCEVYPLLYEEK